MHGEGEGEPSGGNRWMPTTMSWGGDEWKGRGGYGIPAAAFCA